MTVSMAIESGWAMDADSMWHTNPDLMLHYRAATFWSRIFAPELGLGLQTADEVRDIQAQSGRGRVACEGDYIPPPEEDLSQDPADWGDPSAGAA